MSEPIPTRESLAGFIAAEPTLGTTRTGQARWYARIGVEHWSRQRDGTFTELAATYHDLAVYGPLAERLEGRFRKGDKFLAHGTTRTYATSHAGADSTALEFVARRIGHDIARTRYTVQRGLGPNHPVRRGTAVRAVDQSTQAPVPDVMAAGGAGPARPAAHRPARRGRRRRLVPRRTLTGGEPS